MGLYSVYYRDPFPHSLLRDKSTQTGIACRQCTTTDANRPFDYLCTQEPSQAALRRLKKAQHGNNSPHQLGICFTVEVKRGDDNCHQSTLTITAEDRDGAPYAWSGKEFRGEVVGKKAKAENAAARAFLADAAVQETAANMDPPNERQSTPNQKQRFLVLKEFKRAKKAAKAAARQRRPCICKHVSGPYEKRT